MKDKNTGEKESYNLNHSVSFQIGGRKYAADSFSAVLNEAYSPGSNTEPAIQTAISHSGEKEKNIVSVSAPGDDFRKGGTESAGSLRSGVSDPGSFQSVFSEESVGKPVLPSSGGDNYWTDYSRVEVTANLKTSEKLRAENEARAASYQTASYQFETDGETEDGEENEYSLRQAADVKKTAQKKKARTESVSFTVSAAAAAYLMSRSRISGSSLPAGFVIQAVPAAEEPGREEDAGSQVAGGMIAAGLIGATAAADVNSVLKANRKIPSTRETAGIRPDGEKMAQTAGTELRVVRGVSTGRMKVNTVWENLELYYKRAFAGIKKGSARGAGKSRKSIIETVKEPALQILPKAAGVLGTGAFLLADSLKASEDPVLNEMGKAVSTANRIIHAGIRTAVRKSGYSGYTVHSSIYSGKTKRSAAASVRNSGLRKVWNRVRYSLGQTSAMAGRYLISTAVSAVKTLGSIGMIPMLVVVIIAAAALGCISTPVIAVSSIFGGVFSTNDTKEGFDVREFLMDTDYGIPGLSVNFRTNLESQFYEAEGSHDIVRFYSNSGSSEVIEASAEGIDTVFPTDEQLANIIQPLFNAVILMEYDLEPSEAEAKTLLESLFSALFRVTTEEHEEFCGQDLLTGEGEPDYHMGSGGCNTVHAYDDCPDHLLGTHDSYTCADCDYYSCNGHDYLTCTSTEPGHEHTAACYTTEYCGDHMLSPCSNSTLCCDGFDYCNGHDVISFTLDKDGAYVLEQQYFIDPIDNLSNISPRTAEQEEELQQLKDYYEIYLEMMAESAAAYGSGITMEALADIEFVDGSRTPNQAVIDLALSQVGQTGGQPYWSYCGFGSRVAWCACFVHWCMRNTPSASDNYPETSNNAYCQTVADYFEAEGDWADRNHMDLTRGDTIFFDWNLDGHTDHIGLVIGRDDANVYTVEGNSGDKVALKQYPLGSSVIYGYGLMYY